MATGEGRAALEARKQEEIKLKKQKLTTGQKKIIKSDGQSQNSTDTM